MAEYGNNYDYGESPYYKDEETAPDGQGDVALKTSPAIINGIIISV